MAICFLLSISSPAQTNAGATGGSAHTDVMGVFDTVNFQGGGVVTYEGLTSEFNSLAKCDVSKSE